jgi:hypothetical protein
LVTWPARDAAAAGGDIPSDSKARNVMVAASLRAFLPLRIVSAIFAATVASFDVTPHLKAG